MPAPPNVAEPPSPREWRAIHGVLWVALALGLIVACATYADYGATFDEGVQAEYGELAVDYFTSGGADTACNDYLDLRYYGPLVEMPPAWLYRGSDANKYDIRHLFMGLLALLSIPGVWLYGRQFADPRIAAFAVVAVATMPRFYGHWFNNSKDASFAVAVVWYLLALAAMFTGPRVRWSRTLGCGVAMGVALCCRPGGFPLFAVYLAGAAGIWVLTRPLDGDRPPSPPWRAAKQLLPQLAALVAAAWVIMVLPWPWAHENPLLHPIEAMRVASKFHTTVPVLFEGAEIQSDNLPWHFLFKSLWISTPVAVIALSLLGAALGLFDMATRWRSRPARMALITQMWLLVPLAIFVALRPNIHGGVRHFLFVLPAIGVLAAQGAAGILSRVHGARARVATWAGLLGVLALPVLDLWRLHPYQVTFHNAIVGGLEGASKDYWTDYYLSSYAEAVKWVNEQAAATPEKKVVVVLASGVAVVKWAAEYAADNVEVVSIRKLDPPRSTLAPADFFIASTRNDTHLAYPEARVVHEIGRDGVVFTVVKARP